MGKNLNPCVNICKFERGGHCTGCSMTREQKKILKGLNKKKSKVKFFKFIVYQQKVLGGFKHWKKSYSDYSNR